MRVVHVVRQFAPGIGGLEEAVLRLCVTLRGRGIDATVVTLDRIARGAAEPLPARDTVEGVPVVRVPFTGSWRYPLAPGALAHVAGADLVHVHAIDFFFDFFALTRPVHRKPMVASTHGGFFHTGFARRLKQVYFQTATRSSSLAYERILASSEADLALFRPIAGRRVVLAENGVDLAKWAGRAARVPTRHLIAIGRLASNKGLDKLIAILAALRALDPGWRLTIAGRVWDVEPGMLEARAHALGVGDALELIADPDGRQIGAAIERASFIASASAHEGFGIGVVEGMAAGLVPILNNIPPFRSLLDRSGCGHLIDADDPDGAARLIEAVVQGMGASGDAARSASMAAASAFGWPRAADRFIDEYLAVRRRVPRHRRHAEGLQG